MHLLCENRLELASNPFHNPLRQQTLINVLHPLTTYPSRIRRVNDLLDSEVVRRPHGIHQPFVLVFQLFVSFVALLSTLFLSNLLEFIRVSDFNTGGL
jgi:hypothetical protein